MSNPKKALVARVAIGPDVATDQSLVERGGVVGTMAIVTVQYTTNGGFKATIDDFVTSTKDLATSQTKVTTLEAQLASARGDRDQKHIAALAAHGAAVKAVEKVSVAPADVQSYGFLSLDIVKTGLVLPVGILASYNHKTKEIDVLVKYPARHPRQAVHPRDQPRSRRPDHLPPPRRRRPPARAHRVRARHLLAPRGDLVVRRPQRLVRAGVRDRVLRVCSSLGGWRWRHPPSFDREITGGEDQDSSRSRSSRERSRRGAPSPRITLSARRRFRCWSSAIRSSTVSLAMSR